jgi:hypothetical protein
MSPRDPGGTGGRGLRSELRDILWLQRRLLFNALRRGETQGRTRLLTAVLLLVAFLPTVAFASIGLLLTLRGMAPAESERIVAVGFTFLFFIWAAAPLTAQPIFEGIHLSRLLTLPISFAGLALGGIVASAFGLLSILSLPLLAASVAGAARGPASGIAILFSAGLLFVALNMVKAISTSTFELLAEDRRLRGAFTFIATLLPLAIYLEQIGMPREFEEGSMPFFAPDAWSTRLAHWLPGGWYAAAVRSASVADWSAWILAILLLAAFTLAAFGLQIGLMRRLHLGEMVKGKTRSRKRERVASDTRKLPFVSIQESRVLSGLLRKDFLNLRRSPITLRLSFLPLLFTPMAFYMGRMALEESPGPLPLMIGIGALSALMTSAIGMNAFGLFDHKGVASLLLSPASRRLILLSQGLTGMGLCLGLATVVGLGAALGMSDFGLLPITLGTAVLVQLCLGGLGHITSVRFPIYIDLERGQTEANQRSFAATFVLFLGGPLLLLPLIGPVALTAFLAPNRLALALTSAFIYALMAYALQLRFAERMMPAREADIIAQIAENR